MPHLPGSSFSTSSIGFGCASLSAGSSRRDSINLVHAALDAGIRHFDVAPPYGMGTAEDVLGEALKHRRNDVTIATKVGFSRPRHAWAVMYMRSIAAPLRKLVPHLTRRVGASAYRSLTTRPKFDSAFVQSSLTESLRRLRTNHIDLLLLHEVTVDDLTTDLLECLDKLRRHGVVRCLGTGTSYENTLAIRNGYPGFFDAWQYSWSVLDTNQQPPVDFTVTHRAIQRAFAPLRDWLRSDARISRRVSDAIGIDLTAEQSLGYVLLGAAIAHNPGGITLVASRQKSRIAANAGLLSDRTFVAAGQRLIAAMAHEPNLKCA